MDSGQTLEHGVETDRLGGSGHDEADDLGRELGHDEFDPVGTVVLLVLYFLIVAVMWFFMYFVEFMGNGPTVVGVGG